MIEILPIKLLTDEDSLIFGTLAINLGKLARSGLSVGNGIIITPPQFKLKTVLENYDFGTREIFEQSLTLVKKEVYAIAVPEILRKETKAHNFFFNSKVIKSTKDLWVSLLSVWLIEIKDRLWRDGFYPGLTQNLSVQIVIFVKKVVSFGTAFFDPLQDDVVINTKTGKLHPNDLKKLTEAVMLANKKLFILHQYEWILDRGIKLTKVLPFTPQVSQIPRVSIQSHLGGRIREEEKKSAVKVILDLSAGFTIEKNIDGIYIASEKIFDLNRPQDSFENLVFKLVEAAITFPASPVFFKLADKSEGMGQIRGSLRLLHQKSLFDPLVQALDFARHKKGLTNIHIVVPFVRGVNEFLQIKRNLVVNKLSRKNSLKVWLEAAVPENIVNLEDYLVVGLDGVVLNLDELISHFSGFDLGHEELLFYKKEVSGLLKFLEDGIKLLHKSKIPFISYGSLNLYPEILEFLIEKGVYGIVLERYETPSAKDLLYQAERRIVLRKMQQ